MKQVKKINSELLVNRRLALLSLIALGLFVNTLLFDATSYLIVIPLMFLWVVVVRLFSFEGRVSVAVSLVFLTLCPFLLIFKAEALAEKAAIWAYLFLVVGVVQQIVECRESEE